MLANCCSTNTVTMSAFGHRLMQYNKIIYGK